jgi:hypothetical protein
MFYSITSDPKLLTATKHSMVFKSDLTILVLALMSFIASASAASLDVRVKGGPPVNGPPQPLPKPGPPNIGQVYISTISSNCDFTVDTGLTIFTYLPKPTVPSCVITGCQPLKPNPESVLVDFFGIVGEPTSDMICYFWVGSECGGDDDGHYSAVASSNTCTPLSLGESVSMMCSVGAC